MPSEKDKNELLSKLYSLRAGLSLVSQEKQIVDEIFQKADSDRRYNIRIAENKTNDVHKKLLSAEKDRDDTQSKISLTAQAANGTYAAQKRRIPKVVGFFIGLMICIGLIIAVNAYRLQNLLHSFLFFLTVVFFALTIVSLSEYLKFKLKTKKNTDQLTALRSELKKKQTIVEQAIANLVEAQNIETAKKEQIKNQYKQDRAQADPHLLTAKATIDSLNEEYGDFLDPRDWENLDLIIFSVETRRTDNLKDALSIVDSEKRADRITDAVNSASKEIHESIDEARRRMQNSLEAGFTGLSRQITAQAIVLSNQIGQVGSAVAEQSQYIQVAASGAALNNALLEKANKSSQELARDVKSIKSDFQYLKDKY